MENIYSFLNSTAVEYSMLITAGYFVFMIASFFTKNFKSRILLSIAIVLYAFGYHFNPESHNALSTFTVVLIHGIVFFWLLEHLVLMKVDKKIAEMNKNDDSSDNDKKD